MYYQCLVLPRMTPIVSWLLQEIATRESSPAVRSVQQESSALHSYGIHATRLAAQLLTSSRGEFNLQYWSLVGYVHPSTFPCAEVDRPGA